MTLSSGLLTLSFRRSGHVTYAENQKFSGNIEVRGFEESMFKDYSKRRIDPDFCDEERTREEGEEELRIYLVG